jgi:hypothetical protein
VKYKLLSCISILIFLALVAPNFLAQQDIARQPIGYIFPCGPLFFPMNSPRVAEEHAVCLDESALRMTQDKNLVIVLDGHRDAKERKGISITRMNFDRRYLIELKNIDASRIITRNFSDTCSHEGNDVALNQRVEIWFIPKGTDANSILQSKKCGSDSSPKIVTDEKPAPWNWKKKGWTTWGE